MTPWVTGSEDRMGYQATIKKLGLSAIFDIKGDASAASKRDIATWPYVTI